MSKKSKYQERAEEKIQELEKQAEICRTNAKGHRATSESFVREAQGYDAQIALLQSLDGPEADLDVPDDEPHD